MRHRLFLLALALLVLAPAACRRAPVEADFAALDVKGELYLLEGQPFSGIARASHSDGKPKSEYPFHNGRLHGVVREWWDNGVQCTETHFENGKRHGSNKYWDQTGRLTKEQMYEHDHSVSEKHY